MRRSRITHSKECITYNDPMYRKLQELEDDEEELLNKKKLKRLREAIKNYRTQSGLSQGDLAAMLDIEQSNVCLCETGKNLPTLYNLIKLADVFGLKLWALLKEADL